MKMPLVIIGAMLFAIGCSQKPDARDAKIAKLEARVLEIESRYQGLTDSLTNLFDVVHQMNADVKRSMSEINRGMSELMELALKQRDDLQASLTNPPPKQFAAPRYVPAQPQPVIRPSYVATRDGVPLAIYNQIAADAAKEWPSDYQMQAYTIKNQVEAYRKLHP